MVASLKASTPAPLYTKAAILMALKSPAGQRTAWIVVEAEDDVNVYQKFVNSASTVVKTSENDKGRKGYANVESIVTEIKYEVPVAHICGIRDADYTRYGAAAPTYPADVFYTDHRDLEMTLLYAESVLDELRIWAPGFDNALTLCIPICRHLGYLRIYNMTKNLSCAFRDGLSAGKFWDFSNQTLISDWKDKSTAAFIQLVNGVCTEKDIQAFICEKSLEAEDYHDICRGHDLLSFLSKALINTQEYSERNMMLKMTKAYCQADFMSTNLYALIKTWQEREGVTALIA